MLELLVAMSVTVILLGMVTFMTGVSMDGYKGSRDKVLAGRQAKEALDAITKDFEAIVVRKDLPNSMWLYADIEPELIADNAANATLVGPANKKITNACRLIFFTGATDRYDGEIGLLPNGNPNPEDQGGNVSAVIYRLAYRDEISNKNPGDTGAFPSFTLYRHRVEPDEVFHGRKNNSGQYIPTKGLLGAVDLEAVCELGTLSDSLEGDTFKAENVIAENIFEMTVTFLVDVETADGSPLLVRCTISPDDQLDAFAVTSSGIEWDGKIELPNSDIQHNLDTHDHSLDAGVTAPLSASNTVSIAQINKGQLVGVEINMTVLSERGLVMTEKGGMTREDIIKDYGIHYTHSIDMLPRI